jgi:hypothetical protein
LEWNDSGEVLVGIHAVHPKTDFFHENLHVVEFVTII